MQSANRRARVTASAGTLAVQPIDNLAGVPNGALPRPILGGNTTGFHYQPALGDEVVLLAEVANWHSTAVSAGVAAKMAAQQPGESYIYGPNGQVLSVVTAGDLTISAGGAIIHLTAAGAITITAKSGQTITITGDTNVIGTLSVGGVALTVP